MDGHQSPPVNDAVTVAGDGDDFYEEIEAPKFVDFTVPERSRPDDRFWFCSRVGCDQKHEEEMDSEAIYKNFVLRVMAARSPNIRFQKAPNSTSKKCPLSAPAKSSKSRLSRLAVISSISQKIGDAKFKVKPLHKPNSTPNAKVKQSDVVAKALTTLRNKKYPTSPTPFRSVRNPKATSIAVPMNRVVAKTLVFHSPKKAVRTKISVELITPLNKNSGGIKRPEKTSQRKQHALRNSTKRPPRRNYSKPWTSGASRRILSPQNVKSQANGVSQNCKCIEAKSLRCQKLENKEKSKYMPKCPGSVPNEGVENYSSDMEIDEKSKDGSLEGQYVSDGSKNNGGNVEASGSTSSREPVSENSSSMLSDALGADVNSHTNSQEMEVEDDDIPRQQASCEEVDVGKEASSKHEEKISEYVLPESQVSREVTLSNEADVNEDKENEIKEVSKLEKEMKISHEEKISKNVPSEYQASKKATLDNEANEDDDKENNNKVLESDDKENASTPKDNRVLNCNSEDSGGKFLVKHDTNKNTQKAAQIPNKSCKQSFTSAVTGTQSLKHKKAKPTNPKPFRLRTDERGILKEANLERRLQNLKPLKETTTALGFLSANSEKRQGNELLNKTAKMKALQGQAEPKMKALQGQAEPKTGTATPKRHFRVRHQTPNLVDPQLECSRDNAPEKSSNCSRKTKSSLSWQQITKPYGVTPTRKKLASPRTPGQLSMIKGTSSTTARSKGAGKPINCGGATQSAKASSSTAFRSSSQGRTTIPKEPSFRGVLVPNS